MEIGRTFDSFEEFEAHRLEWQAQTFQNFSISSSKKYAEGVKERDTILYEYALYVCIHGEERPIRGEGKRPHQHTRKTGCPVSFKITGSKKSGKLRIRKETKDRA